MQITSRFTTAIHILTCLDYFKEKNRVNSEFLSGSTGVNPVIIRTVISKLRQAGIVTSLRGSSGAKIVRPLSEITIYDVYQAVGGIDEDGLFHFHENLNANCPVGRNIHKVMDKKLLSIQEAMESRMKQITLEEVVEDTKKEIYLEK